MSKKAKQVKEVTEQPVKAMKTIEAVEPAAVEPVAEKRTKANYDVVKGNILNYIKSNPGTTLNQLNEVFGSEMKFPVIYHAVRQLRSTGNVHGTGAKKNEGLYDTAEAAEANKPVPVVRTMRKKDNQFVLEKQAKGGKWRAIEGGNDKDSIMSAYNTASSVPGQMFRVVDNSGESQVVIIETKAVEQTEPTEQTEPAVA